MKLSGIILLLFISLSTYCQKVVRTYHDIMQTKIKEEYQVNSVGAKNGYYKKFWGDGSLDKAGRYKTNVPAGTWKEYEFPLGGRGRLISTYIFQDGKYHGLSKKWCVDPKYYLCKVSTYETGKLVATKVYFPNGKMSSQSVLNGPCVSWHKNGQKKSVWTQADGNVVPGSATRWYANGQIESEVKDGSTYNYFENGSISSEKHPDGTYKSYFENGSVSSEKHPDGTYKSFFPSGKLQSNDYDSLNFRVFWKYDTTNLYHLAEKGSINRENLNSSDPSVHPGSKVTYEYKLSPSTNEYALYAVDSLLIIQLRDRRIINSDHIKTRSLKSIKYNENGIIIELIDNVNKVEKSYYSDGKLHREFNKDKQFFKKFRKDGTLHVEHGYQNKVCCYYKEYNQDGILIREIKPGAGKILINIAIEAKLALVFMSDINSVDQKIIYYTTSGQVEKIEKLYYHGAGIEETITGQQIIERKKKEQASAEQRNIVSMNKEFKVKYEEFTKLYVGKKDVPFLVDEYGKPVQKNDYLKGKHLYNKAESLFQEYLKQYNEETNYNNKAKQAALINVLLEKLISLASTDTKELDKQMKKAKTSEEIKTLLGL